jgi:tetratricopeptide (TPR) repeat protein
VAKRKSRSRASHPPPPHQLSATWGLLPLLIIDAMLYARTLGFSFVYDDTSQIAQNPTIRSWSYLPQYFSQHIWGYSNVWTNLYRPVFLIYLRICHVLFGLDPAGWHAFAVFVHLLNICLVFFVVRKLLRDNDNWIALLAAAIFAVHPVQLETVAWVSGMTDSLTTVSLLVGLWCYLEWRSTERTKWLALCVIFFALALLTKESGAVLLLLILAYEFTIGRADTAQRKPARLPIGLAALIVVAFAYCIVRWIVLHSPVGHASTPISAASAIFTIPSVVLRYLRMMLLPYGMSAFFPSYHVSTPSLNLFVLPLVATLLILAAVDFWARRTKSPEIAFASLWIFLGLLPVLNLRMMQPDDFIHIRFLYIPSIGFSWLVAIASRQLLPVDRLRLAAAAALIAVLTAGSFAQINNWRDNVSLYQRGVAIAPGNPVPKTNLAAEYMRANRNDKALAMLDDVPRRNPDFWTANYNRASLAYKRQDWPTTAELMDRVIKDQGLEFDAYVYRGFALMKFGHLSEAEQSVRQGIALRPQARSYHFVLGLILRQEQRWQDALSAFQEELKINPSDSGAYQHIADLPRKLGQSPQLTSSAATTLKSKN